MLAAHGSAQRLGAYLRASMPYDDPGSLTEPEYWAVSAYLLGSRGLIPPRIHLSDANAAELRLATP